LPVRTIAFLEIEAFICANLVTQMEAGLLDPAPIWTNIKTFDAKPFHNKIHGIVGGYPCQPFSHAGERRGVEDERHLWPYILEQIKVIGPQWVFFENVAGHLSLGYEEVRRSLSDIGYRVEEGIFTAEEVGAPHRRERLFILGVMENAGILGWGRWNIGNQGRHNGEIQTKGSGAALGYAESNYQRDDRLSRQKGRRDSGRSGDELAYANGYDTGTGFGSISEAEGKGFSEAHKRERLRGEPGSLNSEVDNSFQSRLEGHTGNDSRTDRWQRQERSVTSPSLFPAGQGNFQYEFEEPRTIKSSVEYTIDGYNFTEDLHRAIGNSVVEQTAELAFLTLLEKHIKNSLS
jgi:DNA (cytosine-5)-methyltransferase 1